MKIISRFVLNANLDVIEEESFEYHGPVALCTGGEEVAAAEALAKSGEAAAAEAAAAGATEAAAAGEMLGGFGSFAGLEGAAFAGPELAGAAGTLALPEAFGALEALGPGALALGEGAGAAEALGGLGSFAGAEALPAVEALNLPTAGAGAADIAGASAVDMGFGPPLAEGAAAPAAATTAETSAAIDAANASAANVGTESTISQRLLDSITKNPLTAGALGLNLASGIAQNRRAGSIPGQLRDIAKPLSQTGADLLAQYKAGKLNPADEFNINKWEHEQIAKVQSQMGGNSTASRNAVAQIQRQAQAMRDQALQGLLNQGLKASGMAVGPLTNAVEAQARQDQQFMQAQSGALQSFLLLQALQSGRA